MEEIPSAGLQQSSSTHLKGQHAVCSHHPQQTPFLVLSLATGSGGESRDKWVIFNFQRGTIGESYLKKGKVRGSGCVSHPCPAESSV